MSSAERNVRRIGKVRLLDRFASQVDHPPQDGIDQFRGSGSVGPNGFHVGVDHDWVRCAIQTHQLRNTTQN